MVGDSISGNLHKKTIETATKAKLRIAKAYSSIHENVTHKGKHSPKFPTKIFNDVFKNELKKNKEDILIVQSGSVDITNLKTESANDEHFEYFKQQSVMSAINLFTAVTNAAANHPHLKKIIILKQIPRYDFPNPPGLKHCLSQLYNETLDQLYAKCAFKDKLSIGNHSLGCSGGILQAKYNNIQSGKFDGTHRGRI